MSAAGSTMGDKGNASFRFFGTTQSMAETGLRAHSTGGRRRKPRATLHMEEVLRFCFPPDVEHPHTAARLYLVGMYGPLHDGWLWGGHASGRRKLSEHEIETMMKQVEREDCILSVQAAEDARGRNSRPPPTPKQEDEVLRGIPEDIRAPWILSQQQIVKLLKKCAVEQEPVVLPPSADARLVMAAAEKLLAEVLHELNMDEEAMAESPGAASLTPADVRNRLLTHFRPAPTVVPEEGAEPAADADATPNADGEGGPQPEADTQGLLTAATAACSLDVEKMCDALLAVIPRGEREAAEGEGEGEGAELPFARRSGGDSAEQAGQLTTHVFADGLTAFRDPAALAAESAAAIAAQSTRTEPLVEFGPSGLVDLTADAQLLLCFHQAQLAIETARKKRVQHLRRMGESSLAKTRRSRRKDVNRGEDWDDTCVLRATLRPAYVKSRNTERTQRIQGINGDVCGLLPD